MLYLSYPYLLSNFANVKAATMEHDLNAVEGADHLYAYYFSFEFNLNLN